MTVSAFSHQNRGAALLIEAAEMGDADAQYELGRRLRVEVRVMLTYITRNHPPISGEPLNDLMTIPIICRFILLRYFIFILVNYY